MSHSPAHDALYPNAEWFAREILGCPSVIIEPRKLGFLSRNAVIPDVLAFNGEDCHYIDAKVTKADLKAQWGKQALQHGVPAIGSHRWIICPQLLFEAYDVAEHGYGLIYAVDAGHATEALGAPKLNRYVCPRDFLAENTLRDAHAHRLELGYKGPETRPKTRDHVGDVLIWLADGGNVPMPASKAIQHCAFTGSAYKFVATLRKDKRILVTDCSGKSYISCRKGG